MGTAPRFSVIMPVYNVGAYLDESVGSVLAQTYGDYEVILVDDGSTDGSGEKCDVYAAGHPNFRVIHQENRGLLLARRAGLAAAEGDYVVTLDSDDMLRPDALAAISEQVDAHAPDIVAFDFSRATDFATFGPSRLGIAPGFYGPERYDLLRAEVCGGRHNNLWSKCYRRSIADADADYSALRGLTHAEDLLQLLPIVDAGRTFSYVGETLYYYRPNPGSATGSYRPRQLDDLSAALDALLSYASSWGDEFLLAARRGALLQVSYLLHMLVASRPDKDTLRDQVVRIRDYAAGAGLFGPWSDGLRPDKRLEVRALERGDWRRVVWAVRAFEALKRARDARARR